MSSIIVKPIIDVSMRGLCKREYPNHKRGCPNWDKKQGCPPKAPMIDKILNVNEPVYAIYNKYPFGEHVRRMKDKHPDWTKRQAECCLYWQGTARKNLREKTSAFIWKHPHYSLISCSEGAGVNLTETMKNAGIELEWPPEEYTYQIVLVGLPAKE